MAIYDPVTGEVTNSDELEDELDFDIESFNKQVIYKVSLLVYFLH